MKSFSIPNTDGATMLTKQFKYHYQKYRSLLHFIHLNQDFYHIIDDNEVRAADDFIIKECGRRVFKVMNLHVHYTNWITIWKDLSKNDIFVHHVKEVLDTREIVEFLNRVSPCGISAYTAKASLFEDRLVRCYEELKDVINMENASPLAKENYEILDTWIKSLVKDGPKLFQIPSKVYKLVQSYGNEDLPDFEQSFNSILLNFNGLGILRPCIWAIIVAEICSIDIYFPEYKPHQALVNATVEQTIERVCVETDIETDVESVLKLSKAIKNDKVEKLPEIMLRYRIPNTDGLSEVTSSLQFNYLKYRSLLHFIYKNRDYFTVDTKEVRTTTEFVIDECRKIIQESAETNLDSTYWQKVWEELSRDDIFVYHVTEVLSSPNIIGTLSVTMPCGITRRLHSIVLFGESLKRCHDDLAKKVKTRASRNIRDDYEILVRWMKSLQKDGPDNFKISQDIYEMAEKYSWEASPKFAGLISDILNDVKGNGALRPYVWGAIIEEVFMAEISICHYKPHPAIENAIIQEIPDIPEENEIVENCNMSMDGGFDESVTETNDEDKSIRRVISPVLKEKKLHLKDKIKKSMKNIEKKSIPQEDVKNAEREVTPEEVKMTNRSEMRKRKCANDINKNISLDKEVREEFVEIMKKTKSGPKNGENKKTEKTKGNGPYKRKKELFTANQMFMPISLIPGMKIEGMTIKISIESMTFHEPTSEIETSS